ncbi:hypothetical protein ACZ90_11145 [Streptomyces albus subsp. albus]|nr:hypothetical protein ACZ90_11145 [Streptomyces albus subsp. albus]
MVGGDVGGEVEVALGRLGAQCRQSVGEGVHRGQVGDAAGGRLQAEDEILAAGDEDMGAGFTEW